MSPPRVTDALLQALLDQSSEGMAAFAATGHRICHNRAWVGLLGVTGDVESLSRLIDALQASGFNWPEHQTAKPWTVKHGDLTLRGQPGPQGSLLLRIQDCGALVQAERERSEFLAVAAHEMRNPVASMVGFAELLRKRNLPRERLDEVAEVLCRQSSLLSALIEDLLSLARLEARGASDFRFEPIELPPLLTEVMDSLPQDHVPSRIHLRIAPSARLVWADRFKLAQVLANVLSNALKYSPRSTAVQVSARIDGRLVRLMVADQGVGMTADQQARAFERFYRADPNGPVPGTGLGLSVVRDIVTCLGGDVRLEAAPGRGCTVTLTLPHPNAIPANPAQPEGSTPQRVRAGLGPQPLDQTSVKSRA